MSADLAALRLHVRYDEGDGPVIVLLHGINSDAEDWRTVIERIGPGYRCIAVDLLGFGESPRPLDIDYTADDHSIVLGATLADLGIRERFVLVGYSLGGDIAVRYAALHPEKIRRLFLLSTPFYLPAAEFSRRKFGSKYASKLVANWVWRYIARQKASEGVAYDLASGRLESAARGFLRTDDVPTHWDIMGKNLTNCIGAATFVDDLPKLSMPVVFALGVRDPIVHPDQTPALKRLKPDMEIRRIVGLTADHFLLMNLPEKVADEIMRDEVTSLSVPFRGGKGQPLVLLHGLEATSEQWRPVGVALAKRNQVAIVDLLGFGGSAAPPSSHYTLEDHAAAVWATARRLFGDRPVRFVGQGVGATIALQCAAERPDRVSEIVAFSPALVPPVAPGAVLDDAIAELRATLSSLETAGADERARAIASEHVETQVVPGARTLSAILDTDASRLLEAITAPVVIVAPDADRLVPRAWLAGYAAEHPAVSVVETEGGRLLPFEDPVAAAKLIEPGSEEVLAAARREEPIELRKRGVFAGALKGTTSLLFRRGAMMLTGGLVLLLVPGIPARLIPIALAIWLLVEAIQTVSGAFDLRRSGKSWAGWLLVGLVSFAFALFLTVRDAFALKLTALAVAVWAMARGAADLYVAWRVRHTPGARWALFAEGFLGLLIGVLVLVAPQLGGPLLRYTLGAYMAIGGVAVLVRAWALRRATVARLDRVLAHSRRAAD